MSSLSSDRTGKRQEYVTVTGKLLEAKARKQFTDH